MKTKTTLTMTALSFFILISCKKEKEDPLNETDRNFMMMAAYGNYNEIDAGQLAATKATDASVKSFGNLMATEHQMALDELKALNKEEVSLPDGPDPEHITLKQQLNAMSGQQFDSAYIHSQVKDHQKTITLFQDEINNGKDQDVKSYANKFLPHIQMHFNRADTTANRF